MGNADSSKCDLFGVKMVHVFMCDIPSNITDQKSWHYSYIRFKPIVANVKVFTFDAALDCCIIISEPRATLKQHGGASVLSRGAHKGRFWAKCSQKVVGLFPGRKAVEA